MFNLDSPRVPFTVNLPCELVAELQAVARDTGQSVDEIVMEACATNVEALGWEHDYKEWCRANPAAAAKEWERNGSETAPQPERRETAE